MFTKTHCTVNCINCGGIVGCNTKHIRLTQGQSIPSHKSSKAAGGRGSHTQVGLEASTPTPRLGRTRPLPTPSCHLELGWLQCEGQTQAPRGAFVLAKGLIAYDSPKLGLDASAPNPELGSWNYYSKCSYQNIIICVINIIIFIIIKSINIKNSLFVL